MYSLKREFSLLAALFLLSAATCFAQSKATLSGTIKNPKGKRVYLTRDADGITGKTMHVDSATLDKKGNFSMIFNWNQPGEATFAHGNEITTLYLMPGDKLNLTLNTAEFDESLKYSGNGAVINNFLAQKILRDENLQMQKMKAFRMEEEDFLRFSDSVRQAETDFVEKYFAKYHAESDIANAFAQNQIENIKYSWATDRLSYPGMHNYFSKRDDPYKPDESYYSFLDELLENSGRDAPSDAYLKFADAYLSHLAARVRTENEELKKEPFFITKYNSAGHFKGKTRSYLQTKALYEGLAYDADVDAVEPHFDAFRAENEQWSEHFRIVATAYDKALPLRAGNPAPDFTATTDKGKKIKLSDYKGKLVYVDVWASWCGPCVQEIPAAKKLMDELKGKDVVFLNISVDQSDKAWRAALDKHGVHGVNALASGAFKSEIAQRYNINAIPRYLLIGRDGKIINSSAGRPSGKGKEEIEAAL